MNGFEKGTAEIDPERVSKKTVYLQHQAKQPLNRFRFGVNGIEDLFVKEVPEPGYGRQDRRLKGFHRLAKLGRREFFQVTDLRPKGRSDPKIDDLEIRM